MLDLTTHKNEMFRERVPTSNRIFSWIVSALVCVVVVVGALACVYLNGYVHSESPLPFPTKTHDTVRVNTPSRVDTLVIHDTVVLHSQPITFVCEGICTDIQGFSRQ